MSRNKKDAFRKVVGKAEAEKPGDDLASLVMQQITAETQDEVVIAPGLKKLLQQHAADVAPVNLTHHVMAQVNPACSKTQFQPIISKKGWYIIASSILSVIVIIVLLGGSDELVVKKNFISDTIRQVNAMSPVLVIAITSCGMLLALEHLITNRFKLNRS